MEGSLSAFFQDARMSSSFKPETANPALVEESDLSSMSSVEMAEVKSASEPSATTSATQDMAQAAAGQAVVGQVAKPVQKIINRWLNRQEDTAGDATMATVAATLTNKGSCEAVVAAMTHLGTTGSSVSATGTFGTTGATTMTTGSSFGSSLTPAEMVSVASVNNVSATDCAGAGLSAGTTTAQGSSAAAAVVQSSPASMSQTVGLHSGATVQMVAPNTGAFAVQQDITYGQSAYILCFQSHFALNL